MVQRPKTAVAQKQLWLGLVPIVSQQKLTFMLANNSRIRHRYLALLMSVVFATATSPPIQAQRQTPLSSQLLAPATPNPSRTLQPRQAFGGQLAVFFGDESAEFRPDTSVEFSSDSSRILTFKRFALSKYISGYLRLWDTSGSLLAVLQHEDNQIKSAIFSPDAQKILTTDDRNVRLWDRNGNLLTTFSHEEFFSAKFSPDSSQVLTIAKRDVRLWDRRGNLMTVLQYEYSDLDRAIFSPDSRRIITIGEWSGVRFWNKEGNLLAALETEHNRVSDIVFSPDGNFVLIEDKFSNSLNSYLLDKDGNLLTVIRMNECLGIRIVLGNTIFSPDGNYLLRKANQTVCLWDNKSNLIEDFLPHPQEIRSIQFSLDGRYILTNSVDDTARLWDRGGSLLATLQHQGPIHSLQFSPDGLYILTSSNDKTARLWNLEGETIAILQNKGEWISDPVFSPDGNYILAKSGIAALLWDKQGNPLATIQGHAGINSIDRAIFSPDGRYIVTVNEYDDKTSRLWDVSAIIAIQMQQRAALQNLDAEVSNRNAQLIKVQGAIAELSPDGQYILTAGLYHEARLWDMRGNLLTVFPGHESWIGSVAFSPDSSHILTTAFKNVYIWHKEGRLLGVLQHNDSLRGAKFSPDGHYILATGQDAAYLWDREGNLLTTLFHSQVVRTKFSPDGHHILTAGDDDTARLWDIEGNLLTVFHGHADYVSSAEFSPDGQTILTASGDNTARLWDTKGKLLTVFEGRKATFSPDGQTILTASEDNAARLWDRQGNLLSTFQGHEDRIVITEFSPDGSRILTAGIDHTARLWDREGNPLAIFRGHEIFVTDADFTPDGRYILTTSIQDDTTRLWDVSTAIAIQAEEMAALQTSQATVSDKNAPQAEAALQSAIQLNQQDTIESRQQALQKLEEALNLYRADNNSAQAAHILRLIGNINANLGQFQTALDAYNQALPLSQQAGVKAEEAAIFNSLGQLYSELADLKTALDYYYRALPLLYQLNDKGGAATTFNNIGTIQSATKEWANALDSYTKALILSRPAGDLTAEATALSGIGSTYIASEDWATALNAYNQSFIITRYLNDKIKETTILNQMGKIHAALGDNSTALENYTQALALSRQLGYKTEEANILYNQAIFNRQQNNLTAAKTDIETAIQIIEDLRTKIGSQDLRTSYFATVQGYYRFYIDLLMQLHQQDPSKGYNAQALHISERARARSLLEQLTEAGLDLNADLDPALKAEEQRLTQALNAADQKRINLLNNPDGYTNTELEAAKAEIEQILNQLQNLEARIRSANPAYANLKYPDPLTLAEIQTQILDDNTLLLQYALGAERSYLFLVSKTDLKTYELPPKAEIEAAVEEYRELLLNPGFKDLSQGQNLSQMLLGQVAGELQGQRLVIVGDGKLQLLPFAALPVPVSSASTALKSQTPSSPSPFSHNGEKGSRKNFFKSLAQSGERDLGRGPNPATVPLLANHEIITLPSATSLAVQREQWQKRQPAPRTLAVIADPVFKPNDPRLGENATDAIAGNLDQYESLVRNSCGDFDRLPNTATEAEQILALVPDAEEFSATGFEANYAAAMNPNLSQYRILHLATHGCIQDNPLLSNLALSFFTADGQPAETSLLKLQDIYNLELNADLVVLSACQTGTGKEVQGEGIVGLTRGFMYAGARRVTVSLWSVNDRATSILMSDYYRKMLEQGLDPAAALRQAQLTMWQSESYSAPYYWAAFTMQGDW